jgi:predicted component of type VI protein secretion system
VELCAREPLDFDVELKLAADAVPSFLLSGKSERSQLGRDTRLRGAETTAEVMVLPDVGNMDFQRDDAPAAAAE